MASPYSDLSRPPLRAEALRAALVAPAGPLARLEVVDEVGSTNAELLARAGDDPGAWPHLSVLTAEHQSAGRGRLGRTWSAPPRSGLAVSVLLRPHELAVPVERWSWLPLLAGLSVVTALRRVAGVVAVVKWPNDVLVGDGKVAGILAEALPGGAGDGAGVVLGVGLNVTLTRAELPVPTATSLALAGAVTTDRDVLLRSLLRTLAGDVARWAAAGGDAAASGLAAGVREVCATIGRQVAVDTPDGQRVTGVAEGLDDGGRLLLRPAGGSSGGSGGGDGGGDGGAGGVLALGAGDVVHLR